MILGCAAAAMRVCPHQAALTNGRAAAVLALVAATPCSEFGLDASDCGCDATVAHAVVDGAKRARSAAAPSRSARAGRPAHAALARKLRDDHASPVHVVVLGGSMMIGRGCADGARGGEPRYAGADCVYVARFARFLAAETGHPDVRVLKPRGGRHDDRRRAARAAAARLVGGRARRARHERRDSRGRECAGAATLTSS